MSNNVSYKEYKETDYNWLHTIPKGWEIKKLKRGIEFLTDFEANGSFQDVKDNVTLDTGEPFAWYVRATDLENMRYGFDSENRSCDQASYNYLRKTRLVGGELLVAKRGEIGKVYLMPTVDIPATLAPNLYLLRFNGSLYPKFVNYWFVSELGKKELVLANKSTTIGALYKDDIKESYCIFPEIEEQRCLAEFLDQKTAEIDSLIADKEKLIALLEEQRQAIINEAITKGLNTGVKMKDSGVEWIGEIPEEWRISRIKYQADINKNTLTENTDSDFEMEYIDIGSVNSKGEVTNVELFTFEKAPSRARRVLTEGDTIVSTVRTYLKAITWFEKVEGNLICSTGFAVLSPKETIHRKYLSYLLRSTKYIDEIVSRSTGVSYPAITASEIGLLECLLPDIDEQIEIVEYIDKRVNEVDSLIVEIGNQIDRIKEYRKSLIFEAVSGKIDVRDVAAEVTPTA